MTHGRDNSQEHTAMIYQSACRSHEIMQQSRHFQPHGRCSPPAAQHRQWLYWIEVTNVSRKLIGVSFKQPKRLRQSPATPMRLPSLAFLHSSLSFMSRRIIHRHCMLSRQFMIIPGAAALLRLTRFFVEIRRPNLIILLGVSPSPPLQIQSRLRHCSNHGFQIIQC